LFALHLVDDGCGIRTVREILGHKDVGTTMIRTHVPHRGGKGVKRPVDVLGALWVGRVVQKW